MNNVFIAGHLGADPEVRYTSGGQKVTVLRVACNNRRSGKDETIWWKVTIWGEQFDKMVSYLKKGSPVMVQGDLSKPEIYKDREGNPQISLNITATSLHFSPFGRSQEKQEMSPQPQMQNQLQEMAHAGMPTMPKMQSAQDQSSSMPFPGATSFQPTDMSHGQGNVGNFNDDEIPF